MKKRLILNFHKIHDTNWFEKVILLLKSYFTLTNLELISDRNICQNKRLCHLTFDDGDNSFYDIAFPVLQKYKVPATIFVSPEIIKKEKNFWFQEIENYDVSFVRELLEKELSLPLEELKKVHYYSLLKTLSLEQINKVIKSYQESLNILPKACMNMNYNKIVEIKKCDLIEFGAHTLNHPILTNETEAIADQEITGSIEQLEEIIGKKIKYFAYPNGTPQKDFGSREIKIVKKNNIRIAVSTESKYISEADNVLSLPRIGLSHGNLIFVTSKLVLGKNWQRIKNSISYSEVKEREIVASQFEGKEYCKISLDV